MVEDLQPNALRRADHWEKLAGTRPDGRAVEPSQLQADKAICCDEVDQAARITAARGLAPIRLSGQDGPVVKLSSDCMALGAATRSAAGLGRRR
jgi:hypothetical protein